MKNGLIRVVVIAGSIILVTSLHVLINRYRPQGNVGGKEGTIIERRLESARQLILVVTPEWGAIEGKLQRYERTEGGSAAWRQYGEALPVVVGKNGLAWAAEFTAKLGDPSDPVKREGDGRSPAGIFTIGPAFGYDPASSHGQLMIDYLQVTKDFECVDDCQSTYYNQLRERSRTPRHDWSSSEVMRRDDDYYRLGVVINHNYPEPVACRGSCIFLHLWEGPGIGTVGCTAMAAHSMVEVVRWLDRARMPVLIQMTETHRRLSSWVPHNK